MVRSIATALACLVLLASAAMAQTIYVAVTTKPPADPAFPTLEERGCRDSVKDLVGLLGANYSFANAKHPADVTLEVLRREQDPTDNHWQIVHVKLTAGEYQADIAGRDSRWWTAAISISTQFDKWATKAKRRELISRRPPRADKKKKRLAA